jgi:outer membrane protein assembly factor BamB
VIEGNRVWLTTAFETPADPEDAEERLKANTGGQPLTLLAKVSLHAIGLDRDTGELRHNLPLMSKETPQWVHQQNSYASPTAVIEDGKLYAHFGAYGTACLDTRTGKVLWTNQSLHVMHENGPGSCPMLWRDKLIFHMDGSDAQYIVALDKATGEVAWKTERSGEMHENPQLKKAYGTPLIAPLAGRDQLLSNAANWLYAYAPETGEELWKMPYGKLGFSNVPRPVVGHGLIYLATGFMKSELLAVKADGRGTAEVAWNYRRNVPTAPSPILVEDRLYFVSDQGGVITCLNAKTGELVWKERAGGNAYWASPLYGDGKLFFHAEDGRTLVLKPGDAFEKLAENQLDGRIMGSSAVADDALFLRTDQALYRIQSLPQSDS